MSSSTMTQKEKPLKVPIAQKFVVGAVAGITGTTCIYPIDMVKTRLQNQVSKPGQALLYRNPIHCFTTILKNEGFKGLYRGLGANLVGVTPEKAIKLAVNEILRESLCSDETKIELWQEMLAGAGAGFTQVLATNPMEIVKIRMQVQGTLPAAQRMGAMAIVRDLGFFGLYTGASACLIRDVPFSFIFFPLYSNVKKGLADTEGKNTFPTILLSGMIAGSLSAGFTTPIDVAKTRLQVPGAVKKNPLILIREIAQNEGVGALYKGIIPRMTLVGSLFAISLLAFETQKTYYLTGKLS